MVITPDWLWGDVGSNPAQGKLSFKHLFLKYDYLECALSGFLSYTLSLSIYIYSPIYIYIDESLLLSNCACSLEYSSSSTLAGLS